MNPYYLDILMFVAMVGGILIGFPVVFILTGVGVIFAGIGFLTGDFNPNLLRALSQRIFGVMTNEVLIAIPLFIFMGVMLERSRIAEQLLEQMGRLFGHLRGGLAISVTVVGALLAASTGIVGATVVTMGLIALPTMMRNGYKPTLAAGTVCAAGTLGQIIPPSTMLVIMAEVMSSAYQQAQYSQGLFIIETLSVGQVFAGAMIPGLVTVGVYLIFVTIIAWLRPQVAPALVSDSMPRPALGPLLLALLPPVILIVAVLGSILGGIATPTEAAAVGAVGAIMLAAMRFEGTRRWPIWLGAFAIVAMLILAGQVDLRIGRAASTMLEHLGIVLAALLTLCLLFSLAYGLWRGLKVGVLGQVVDQTVRMSAMIFAMFIGASLFALVFRGLGGDARVESMLDALPGGQTGALLFVLLIIFLLGFVLDFVEIAIILIPLVAPVLLLMGIDAIWLSILIAINLQTSFLTPPFGFSLFYLRGAAPPEIRTIDIYRGVAPFVGLNILVMSIVFFIPDLATWLPEQLFGRR
ncbi:MAG TPA: TRAP transporter large permease subunit [Kiloniellales bacterium]|nr:TRAP transporter large permease subunit [Kiloniellales bacterium]